MENADNAIRYGMSFVAKGSAPATYVQAEMELRQAGTDLLLAAMRSGKYRNGVNGKRGYNLGHKFSGRMKVANKPYQTEVMRSNGSGGFRSPRPSVHGSGPRTRA